eukprot:CAMPEP_0171009348 /NCGR_PEP_ID=MMETSP0736-20130129/21240_1 /TAXON_ID=186038 /ORGANISM="Fragilariopsis kerguelensis, Strain L26-C5" /LENGTH=268 /DNA_ID=CAMNT_0011440889 /DNA_START=516 /DNA_END=1323 /DNA_ORIENTATION=+
MAMDSIREQHQHYHLENPMKYPTPTLRKDQLLFVPIDLTDFQSIHHAVKCIQQHLELRTSTLQATVATEGLGGRIPTQYIYSVICNAGLMMGTQTTTKDGYETMMQANHLGHFLLLKLLLDKEMLKTTIVPTTPAVHDEPSRICILTSSTYEFSANENGFDFTDPFCSEGKRAYTLFGQYSMTKLANLLFAQELSKRYNNNNNNTKLCANKDPILRQNGPLWDKLGFGLIGQEVLCEHDQPIVYDDKKNQDKNLPLPIAWSLVGLYHP